MTETEIGSLVDGLDKLATAESTVHNISGSAISSHNC